MSTQGTDYTLPLRPAQSADIDDARQSIFDQLAACFPLESDSSTRQISAVIAKEHLHDAVLFLRDTPEIALDTLLDIVGIDYLEFPGHQGPRFAVSYLLKSQRFAAHRFQLKIRVDEGDLDVPTISDLFAIANWQEREVFDQYGVRFVGHPNLKRLLNHFEFVGHPLRKDYPAQKRQWLSTNDPLVDQLEARLHENGFKVLEPIPLNTPDVQDVIKGDRL